MNSQCLTTLFCSMGVLKASSFDLFQCIVGFYGILWEIVYKMQYIVNGSWFWMALCATVEVVLSASEQAFSLIDMTAHEGIHPCMGAVDLVPFYPLGEEVSLEDCGKAAQGKVILLVNICSEVTEILQKKNCNLMLFSLLSFSHCSDRASARHQCVFLWPGRYTTASWPCTQEEGAGLVQEGSQHGCRPARCWTTACETIWTNR